MALESMRLRTPGRLRSELPHERYQILLLLRIEFQLKNKIEELDGVLERKKAAVVQIRRAVFNPPQRERLDRPNTGFLQEALQMQVVHLMVEVEGRGVTACALPFAEEHLLAAPFAFGRLTRIETSGCRVELRCRRKVQHVLHLSHVTDLNAIEDHHALLHGVNRIAVEVGSPLFELREVLD